MATATIPEFKAGQQVFWVGESDGMFIVNRCNFVRKRGLCWRWRDLATGEEWTTRGQYPPCYATISQAWRAHAFLTIVALDDALEKGQDNGRDAWVEHAHREIWRATLKLNEIALETAKAIKLEGRGT